MRDIEAAQAAGAKPVLVRTGFGRETEAALGAKREGVAVYNDLAAFAAALIATA
jgi:D-glycero-D-manno-heptose 1,7-bisphosphate phosphatase